MNDHSGLPFHCRGLNEGISRTQGLAVCPWLAHTTVEKQGQCCCCARDSVCIFRACGLGQRKDSADDNGAHCLPSRSATQRGLFLNEVSHLISIKYLLIRVMGWIQMLEDLVLNIPFTALDWLTLCKQHP